MITIRKLDDSLKQRLRQRAAKQGHSMEEEARIILKQALVEEKEDTGTWLRRFRKPFAELGGIELELPERSVGREPPDFSDSEYDHS